MQPGVFRQSVHGLQQSARKGQYQRRRVRQLESRQDSEVAKLHDPKACRRSVVRLPCYLEPHWHPKTEKCLITASVPDLRSWRSGDVCRVPPDRRLPDMVSVFI